MPCRAQHDQTPDRPGLERPHPASRYRATGRTPRSHGGAAAPGRPPPGFVENLGRPDPRSPLAQGNQRGPSGSLPVQPGSRPRKRMWMAPAPGMERPRATRPSSVIATDAKLSRFELAQWGRQVHTSMARAIHPFHTARDGDVLFAVTTAAGDRVADNGGLGLDAADAVW